MGYGILIWIAAVVAQPPEQAGKGAVPEAKAAARSAASEEASVRMKDARRLLRNGRYAEAEEALTTIRSRSQERRRRV